jgi:hypothetical protein
MCETVPVDPADRGMHLHNFSITHRSPSIVPSRYDKSSEGYCFRLPSSSPWMQHRDRRGVIVSSGDERIPVGGRWTLRVF